MHLSLNLDARQRAMLEEMGITFWWPQSASLAPAPAAPAALRLPRSAPEPAPANTAQTARPAAPPTTSPTARAPQPSPATQPSVDAPPAAAPSMPRAATAISATTSAAANASESAESAASAQWHMAPWVPLFPQASGSADGGPWLIVWESPCPLTPLAGDVGQLLGNMLRALRLHEHPQVWLAGVQRPHSKALPIAGSLAPVDWQPLASRWPQALASVQPARVLLLGQQIAHQLLGSHEPVGQLRLRTHTLDGIATAVSYDPAYLLRAAHAKPNAWADLCRAWHLGRGADATKA